MQPYSNTDSAEGNQSPDGNENNTPQSPLISGSPSTIKEAYERNIAVFNSNQHLITYGKATIVGDTKSALPSATASVFTPDGTNNAANNAARFTATKMSSSDRKIKEGPQNLAEKEETEKTAKEDGEEVDKGGKTQNAEACKTSPSSSDGSVGSWTDDDVFISHGNN